MASNSVGDRLDATVLVVDDDDDFRAVLADSLEEDGCGVLAVHAAFKPDAQVVLQAIRRQLFLNGGRGT
jgi:CheY-like chemotaxis protein